MQSDCGSIVMKVAPVENFSEKMADDFGRVLLLFLLYIYIYIFLYIRGGNMVQMYDF